MRTKVAPNTPAYQKPGTVSGRLQAKDPLQVGPAPINTNMVGRDTTAEFMAKKHPTSHSRKGK